MDVGLAIAIVIVVILLLTAVTNVIISFLGSYNGEGFPTKLGRYHAVEGFNFDNGPYGFNSAKSDEISLIEGLKGEGFKGEGFKGYGFNNAKFAEISLLEGLKGEGFADRFNEPAGYFATSGGDWMDDVVPDDSKRIFGGKEGNNEFAGGCGCRTTSTNGCGCALGVTGMKTPYVADNSSVFDFAAFGAEYNVMNNSVGKGNAYLSPTDYMPEGTNLFFEGDLYVPPYSDYSPPLF